VGSSERRVLDVPDESEEAVLVGVEVEFEVGCEVWAEVDMEVESTVFGDVVLVNVLVGRKDALSHFLGVGLVEALGDPEAEVVGAFGVVAVGHEVEFALLEFDCAVAVGRDCDLRGSFELAEAYLSWGLPLKMLKVKR
jgi:hypothetical protein